MKTDYKWHSYVDVADIPRDGKVQVRTSDDQFDEEDWAVLELTLEDGKITSCRTVQKGLYECSEVKLMTTIEELSAWTMYDGTGRSPEMENDLRVVSGVIQIPLSQWEELPEEYKDFITDEEQFPGLVGRRTVLSSCISNELSKLYIEGLNFEIVKDY